jgi:pimeloyl-ACP methyl ester carboxylesterase
MWINGLAAILLVLSSMQVYAKNPPYPRGSIEELFPASPPPVERTYRVGDRSIHYWQVDGGPARVVFLHGTPGDWKAWAHYLADPALRARATLIAVDRPGFGASEPGRVAPRMADQARLLAPLLTGPGAPTLLVGHSLGGPIGAELAMRHPDAVRGAVLVAPSIDPATEAPRWYNRLMTWRLVRWIAPDEFGWSNDEIMVLAEELEKQTSRWASLPMPITVVQGAQDELVDPRTAAYAERILPKPWGRVVVIPDQGHFVLWKRPDLVTREILALLDRTESPR